MQAEGIDISIEHWNGVSHLYAVAAPQASSTFAEQATDALDAIGSALRNAGMRGGAVQQTVFLADFGQVDLCRQIVGSFYGGELPVTTYVAQKPCNGKSIAIEVLGVGPENGIVDIDRFGEQLVVARHSGATWAYAAQTVPHSADAGAYDQTTSILRQFRSLLSATDMHFCQTIRTWFYLGGILEPDGMAHRYEQFNLARADFYRGHPFFAGRRPEQSHSAYPASTAVGAAGGGLCAGAIVLATDRRDVAVVPLENPQQRPAFDYSPGCDLSSPRFSRAVAVASGTDAMIFISGTASITERDTRYAGDVVAQTTQTLDNIAVLISKDNLRRHGLCGFHATLDGLAAMRVYLKRLEDCAAVRQVCEDRAGKIPTAYVVADLCRPGLLVEIEGVAFSRPEVSA
jgi:enamine deaminase RidA (YjgF/YER057c/UK114 family)